MVREWCAAQREGNYSIHASQFNTRRPLNLNDRDLAETPYRPARSLREYSQMSYVLCAIDLAYLIRESVDMLHQQTVQGESHHILTHENRRLLDAKYQNFLFELPPYFRLGSDLGSNDSGAGGIVEVQRYLLHQQAFGE